MALRASKTIYNLQTYQGLGQWLTTRFGSEPGKFDSCTSDHLSGGSAAVAYSFWKRGVVGSNPTHLTIVSILYQSVAQPGSVLPSEGRSREFKSHRSDHMSNLVAFQDKFDIAAAIGKAIKLRNDGLSAIPIIKAIREEFKIGLRDAKLIYHYSLPQSEQDAQEKFWDELVQTLEKMSEEDL